ncbi:MAG TPA: hypothetical protein VLU46_15370 [Thermoanaerobaculia bacterium]|nr:hypothetical protein [Thermoanaerobaculia bacterium]
MPYAIVTLLSDRVSVVISVGVFTFAAYVIGVNPVLCILRVERRAAHVPATQSYV